MSKSSDSSRKSAIKNPLIWIGLVVIGLIAYIILSAERGMQSTVVDVLPEPSGGAIDRSLLIPPGMRARQQIEQIKADGEPYPLSGLFDKAERFLQEGNLADAHLLFFFSAREGHLPAIMKMAEMADPTIFRPDSSLLDQPDPIQAYKWYRNALERGEKQAENRIAMLKQWALTESKYGNPYARQLLLVIN